MIRIRRPGEFCWINMLTPRPTDAREFFGKVLGWTYVEIPGMGYRVQVGGRDIGGLFDLNSPQTPPGTPAYIGVMVKVESADKTVARIKELGGDAKPPFDIMDQGRMAVCFDPTRAEFDIWEPRKGQGSDADATLHGAPSWFENISTDAARASTFYTSLFGWTTEVNNMGGLFDYTTFKQGAENVAGLMPAQPDMNVKRSHWNTYFTVNDVDKAVNDARALGATVEIEPADIPNVGRFAGIVSPHGVVFFVIKYA